MVVIETVFAAVLVAYMVVAIDFLLYSAPVVFEDRDPQWRDPLVEKIIRIIKRG